MAQSSTPTRLTIAQSASGVRLGISIHGQHKSVSVPATDKGLQTAVLELNQWLETQKA